MWHSCAHTTRWPKKAIINWSANLDKRWDSHPMQYLGYCMGCNSSNINHWSNPMVVKDHYFFSPLSPTSLLFLFLSHFLFQIHQISKNFSLPPNLAVRGTPASNLHDHGYKWKLLRPTRPPPAVLAGLTFSSPNVSLFSRSLKSSGACRPSFWLPLLWQCFSAASPTLVAVGSSFSP